MTGNRLVLTFIALCFPLTMRLCILYQAGLTLNMGGQWGQFTVSRYAIYYLIVHLLTFRLFHQRVNLLAFLHCLKMESGFSMRSRSERQLKYGSRQLMEHISSG